MKKHWGIILLGALAAIAVGFGGWSLWNYYQLKGKRGAYETCVSRTKVMLKSPSTAKFPKYDDQAVTYSGNDKKYTIEAYVDAQNSFGAMVRTLFVCQVSKKDDRWDATEVKFKK